MVLRRIRTHAIGDARASGQAATRRLVAKGIDFGSITASPDGSVDTSGVRGVDPDLRVRPFFAQGGTISIREFIVGALHAEMGLDAADPDLAKASAGGRVVTPAGMVLDGSLDRVEAPPVPNPALDPNGTVPGGEIPTALVDYLEFYLMNYFKPAVAHQSEFTREGLKRFKAIGCASCHIPDLQIDRDRRVADVETRFDPKHGIFNRLFATATALFRPSDDLSGFPALKQPSLGPFIVRNIFTDFKRHDLGPDFYERNWDGTIQKEFLTRALWGVGSKVAYGHDGRSITLTDVILRHGGEAQEARDAFADLSDEQRAAILAYLEVPGPLPAGRHRVEPGPGRPHHATVPAVRSRQHQADRPVQRSDGQGVIEPAELLYRSRASRSRPLGPGPTAVLLARRPRRRSGAPAVSRRRRSPVRLRREPLNWSDERSADRELGSGGGRRRAPGRRDDGDRRPARHRAAAARRHGAHLARPDTGAGRGRCRG